jgi:hypothetical protein
VVCCVSAAAVHDLTDELPPAVQIAVPTHDRPPRITQPPVQVFRFDPETFEVGMKRHEVAPGETVRIYGPEPPWSTAKTLETSPELAESGPKRRLRRSSSEVSSERTAQHAV